MRRRDSATCRGRCIADAAISASRREEEERLFCYEESFPLTLQCTRVRKSRLAVDDAALERHKRWRLVYCALLLQGSAELTQVVATAAVLLNALEDASSGAGGVRAPGGGLRTPDSGRHRDWYFDRGDCVDRRTVHSWVERGLDHLEALGLATRSADVWTPARIEGAVSILAARLLP